MFCKVNVGLHIEPHMVHYIGYLQHHRPTDIREGHHGRATQYGGQTGAPAVGEGDKHGRASERGRHGRHTHRVLS